MQRNRFRPAKDSAYLRVQFSTSRRAPACATQRRSSSHGMDGLGFDLIDHTHLTWPAVGIVILAGVFFRQFINMRIGAVFGDVRHPPANRKVTVRVVRVEQIQSYARIAPHVAVLYSSLG